MKRKISMAVSLAALLAATTVYAGGKGDNDKKGHADGDECRGEHSFGMKRGMMSGMKMSEWMDREFTAEEIKTLASAKLIMKGNSNLAVGEVTDNGNGYTVTIVTQDNSLVKEIDLAKNSMPIERYERVLERMENRQ